MPQIANPWRYRLAFQPSRRGPGSPGKASGSKEESSFFEKKKQKKLFYMRPGG
jgi:hypothetical protein